MRSTPTSPLPRATTTPSLRRQRRPRDDSLLARLRLAWAPTPVHIRRRGDRVPVDQTVIVVTGISSIVHLLRLEALRKAEARQVPASGGRRHHDRPGSRPRARDELRPPDRARRRPGSRDDVRCHPAAVAGQGPQRHRLPDARPDRRPQCAHPRIAGGARRPRRGALDRRRGAATAPADGRPRRDQRRVHRAQAALREDRHPEFAGRAGASRPTKRRSASARCTCPRATSIRACPSRRCWCLRARSRRARA